MKLKINEEELFAPYVETSVRTVLQRPFARKGYVCATNGKMILLVKQDCVNGVYEEQQVPTDRFLGETNRGVLFTLAELQQAVTESMTGEEEKVIHEAVVCSECQGEGVVYWTYDGKKQSYEREFDCPCCEGVGIIKPRVVEKTGRKILDEDDAISIQNTPILSSYIQKICDTMLLLGVDKVEFCKSSFDADVIVCRFSDSIYVVMKRLSDSTGITISLQH